MIDGAIDGICITRNHCANYETEEGRIFFEFTYNSSSCSPVLWDGARKSENTSVRKLQTFFVRVEVFSN